jgi:hypothetical protein
VSIERVRGIPLTPIEQLPNAEARIAELEASVNGVNEQYDAALDTVIEQSKRIAELEAERDRYKLCAGRRKSALANLHEKNTKLRNALKRTFPFVGDSRHHYVSDFAGNEDSKSDVLKAIREALIFSPEPASGQSSPAGERAATAEDGSV